MLALVVLAALAVLPGGGQQLAALFVHPAPVTQPAVPTRVPATPTPSPFPTPTLVAPPIGTMPGDCVRSPTGPALGGFASPVQLYAVGGPWVWVDGFNASPATISITRDWNGAYSAWGWPASVALALKQPFTAVVTLAGSDARTGAPLWWSFEGGDGETPPVPGITVDPKQQLYNRSTDGEANWWNGILYLPGSGCYVLNAT